MRRQAGSVDNCYLHTISMTPCKSCVFAKTGSIQIRFIRRFGKALSVESKLRPVHTLVHSRLAIILIERLSKSYGISSARPKTSSHLYPSVVQTVPVWLNIKATDYPVHSIRNTPVISPRPNPVHSGIQPLITSLMESSYEHSGTDLYGDNTAKLYGFSSPDGSAALAHLIRRAIDSVFREWMASNRILLWTETKPSSSGLGRNS